MRLVLLDIDGTLLSANGAGRRAICAALRELAGSDRGADTCRFDGKTDPQIFGEILGAQGRAARDGEIDRLSTRYLELLGAELADPRYPSQPLPGARELVAALAARTDVIVGLLTGNLFEGAQRKLVAAGFHTGDFAVGAYGSDHATREALVPMLSQLSVLASRLPGRSSLLESAWLT